MISDLFTQLYRPVGSHRIAWVSGGCQLRIASLPGIRASHPERDREAVTRWHEAGQYRGPARDMNPGRAIQGIPRKEAGAGQARCPVERPAQHALSLLAWTRT